MPKLSIIVYVELQKCYLLFKILLIPIVRNQIWSSGEIVSVGNFTRDSDQILQRHDFVENDPSPSQSEITLVLHEITKTRECMNAVFDHLDDLCDGLGAFCEKRERDHRMNKDVAISKSTPPTCSFMESMESDYRPLRVGRKLCAFISKPMVIFLVSVLISLHQAGLIWTSTGGIPWKVEIDMVL